MLFAVTGLQGCPVEASDGRPLDPTPPADRRLPMMSMGDTLVVSVRLTKQQIEASPDAREDEPVTKQMEAHLYGYYRSHVFRRHRYRHAAFGAADPYRSRRASGGGHAEPIRRRRSASPQCRFGWPGYGW
jgi:hypothetical protein